MTGVLTQADIQNWLGSAAAGSNWRYDADKRTLCRDFAFKNFSEAFAFMTRVALAAEKAGHHPDWSNSYNSVSVRLSTHSAGGVTQKDFALAEAMEAVSSG